MGQQKLIDRIRGHVKNGREIKAWLFIGPAGTGKTTTARILSLSLLCGHQTVFGKPCKACWVNKSTFDIYETNCAKVRGIREIEEELQGTDYAPRFGRYRIHILDEVHRATQDAQGLLLKYLEDSPETTLFILCTTEAHLLLQTLKRRCTIYKLRPLDFDDIEKYAAKLLSKVGSELPADCLRDALVTKGVSSPGLIAQAVEKYTAGASPEEAADVIEGNDVDTKALIRSIVKGDWDGARKYLFETQVSDVRGVRINLVGYLRSALLESPNIDDRTFKLCTAIDTLIAVENQPDAIMLAAVCTAAYKACDIFSEYKL